MIDTTARCLRYAAAFLLATACAQVSAQINLPVKTSPIDVSAARLVFRAQYPHPSTGADVDVPLRDVFRGVAVDASPVLQTLFDNQWQGTPAQRQLGQAPIQLACDGPNGVKVSLAAELQRRGYSADDISCEFSQSGSVFAAADPGILYLSYQLLNNKVRFRSDGGAFTVTFAIEVLLRVSTVQICALNVATEANLHGVDVSGSNVLGSIATFFSTRFLPIEVAMQNESRAAPINVGVLLGSVRDGLACVQDEQRTATFSSLSTNVAPTAVTITAIHPPLAAPKFLNDPGAQSQTPRFDGPRVFAAPFVTAGVPLLVRGEGFPPTVDPTALRLELARDRARSCAGGRTEVERRRAGRDVVVQEFPPSAGAVCESRADVAGLSPGTEYRFRVRDCDFVTCSPWSPFLTFRTPTAADASAPAILVLDNTTILGTADVGPSGKFATSVAFPGSVAAGPHVVRATVKTVTATAAIQVAPDVPSETGRFVITSSVNADADGCSIAPAPQVIRVDDDFHAYGANFPPYVTLTLWIDSRQYLGAVSTSSQGTFCARFRGPPEGLLGPRRVLVRQGDTISRGEFAVEVVRNARPPS